MYKTLLGILIMASQLTISAHGCDGKRLDFEADTYAHRIWTATPSEKSMIKNSLVFLPNQVSVDIMAKTYGGIEAFNQYYEDITRRIPDQAFTTFARTCREIYTEGDQREKVSVHLLLQNVSIKSLERQEFIERARALKAQQTGSTNGEDYNTTLDYFTNVDKVSKQPKSPGSPIETH